MYSHAVIEEETGKRLGTLEFEREIRKDECIFHDGNVYCVRWVGYDGPASDHRRIVRVYQTGDVYYVARLD